MMGIRYMRTAPTTYVLHYSGGKLRKEGPGLSFLYYAPTSVIAAVPLGSVVVPFAFSEVAADFQAVTIQGQLTYRVADPRRLAGMLDFTVAPNGSYLSEDPVGLSERLIPRAQVLARAVTQRFVLREILTRSETIVAEVLPALRKDPAITLLGIEVLGFSVLSLKPTPEMAKALEAEAREALQRRSDDAIYLRRNNAVEQERIIKENELATEVAVEEKKRQVRETQMAGEIAIEEQRKKLIETRVENERKDADSRAYALEATLKPVRVMDWRTLMALAAGGGDPRTMIAVAFRELAENAQKIGELNVTPDLLNTLMKGGK
ncbi:MAG TPA: SPFH domain-containing protein [Planctomycetota bacterium]|jgi:regulator of protease activity HflC (stomatin/prohibitin superfamily)|nr:SPFH domain-containing protein [Planctomycetota bacterium]